MGLQIAQCAPHPESLLLPHWLLPPSFSAFTPWCPRSWAWEVEAPTCGRPGMPWDAWETRTWSIREDKLPIPLLPLQAEPRGQMGRGQAGGHCSAPDHWQRAKGRTDPWLRAGSGSGSGREARKGHPGTAGRGGIHNWAGSSSGLAGTRSQETGPDRSGDRATRREEDPGHPHSLRQEGSREGER